MVSYGCPTGASLRARRVVKLTARCGGSLFAPSGASDTSAGQPKQQRRRQSSLILSGTQEHHLVCASGRETPLEASQDTSRTPGQASVIQRFGDSSPRAREMVGCPSARLAAVPMWSLTNIVSKPGTCHRPARRRLRRGCSLRLHQPVGNTLGPAMIRSHASAGV